MLAWMLSPVSMMMIGCVAEATVDEPLAAPYAASLEVVSELPTSLTCVSDALPSTSPPQVLRVSIQVAGAAATAQAQVGPQFWNHGGAAWGEAPATHDWALIAAGGRLTGDGRVIQLGRSGDFLRGTLTGDGPALGLLCWNELEVFGSPWLSVEGALSARFDWGSGRCQDASGAPALNHLPIEVIRETRQGECADLRGQRLNGDDLAYPDLLGWYLPGARLDGASLFFAQLDGAVLNGARLGELTYGYAHIEGTIDDFTELPDGCETTQSSWAGDRVTCVQ